MASKLRGMPRGRDIRLALPAALKSNYPSAAGNGNYARRLTMVTTAICLIASEAICS